MNLRGRQIGVSAAAILAAGTLASQAAPGWVTWWGASHARQTQPPLTLSNVIAVSAGFAHAVALRQDGSVTAWGDDSVGQTRVPENATNILAVAAGARHNVALRSDGTVIGWGDNSFGQLSPPAGVSNCISVAAGATHSLALRANGTVVAWGGNYYGQANPSPFLNSLKDIKAGGFHSLALRTNGSLSAWGYSGNGATVPFSLANVAAIASGYNHSLALRSNGTVVAWGANDFGQTNVPVGLSNVVAVAAGATHSLALRQNGSIVAWGHGGTSVPEGLVAQQLAAGGQFSLAIAEGPSIIRQPTDVVIVPGKTITLEALLSGDGPATFQWQRNGMDLPGETNATLALRDASYDAFGDYRLVARAAGHLVFSQVARLIAPPQILSPPQSTDVYYGDVATLQIVATGSQPMGYRWYFADAPIFGATNATLAISNISFQHAGAYFVVVTNLAGSVTSSVARLTGYPPPAWSGLPSGNVVVEYGGSFSLESSFGGARPLSWQWQFNGLPIAGQTNTAGATFSTLKLDNMRPSMTGRYRIVVTGPPGDRSSAEVGVTVKRANPIQFVGRRIELDAGTSHGLARGFRWLRDGLELEGQTNSTLVLDPVGQADEGDYTVVIRFDHGEQSLVVARATVRPAPPVGVLVGWGWTNGLPGPPLSELTDVAAIAPGDGQVLALRADGQVYRWDRSNRTYSTNAWPSLVPVVDIAARDAGAVLGATGRAAGETGFYCNPCAILETNSFVQVARGTEYAISLRSDGTAIGWGPLAGANPVPSTLRGVRAIAVGGRHAIALRTNGTIAAWGDNSYGQIGFPPTLSGVTAIACEGNHSLALRSNGMVVAWGDNSSGQCNVPPGLAGAFAIGTGVSQSFALVSNGVVVAWGNNTLGQCNVPVGLTGVVAVAGNSSATMAIVGSTKRPALVEHPKGGVREIGETITLRTRAWSTLPVTYQWVRNGTDLPGATNDAMTLNALQLSDEADYQVIVTTSAGSVISDRATLRINPAPFLTRSGRGRLVVWGNLRSAAVPPGLEVASISTGPSAYSSFLIGTDGAAVNWPDLIPVRMPDTNLVSIVEWRPPSDFNRGYLGLRANGVVRAWNSALQEIEPPGGLRDVQQLAGAGTDSYLAVRRDGTIFHSKEPDFFSSNLTDVIQATLGPNHGAVLRADGTVLLSKLSSSSRQTPVPDDLTNVTQIAAGGEHTLALLEDGTVFAWGRTNEGQCAVPAGLRDVTAVAAGDKFSMALRASGQVVVWGANEDGQNLIPPGLTNAVAIAAGRTFCLAIQSGPVVVVPPTDLNVPPGQTGTFQVTAQGAAPLRYQWFFLGDALPGATNRSLSVVAQPESEGLYSVLVSNPDGAASADAMLWLGVPPEILGQPEGGTMATGGEGTLRVLASGTGPLRYQWQRNGVDIAAATNSTYILSAATAGQAGSYRVLVSNEFGTTGSAPVSVVILDPPVFLSQPMAQTGAMGETTTFTVTTSG